MVKLISIIVAALIGLALLAWGGYLAVGMVDCWSKWRRSGMDYEFTSISGCLVEIESNKWIPDNRYRGMEE